MRSDKYKADSIFSDDAKRKNALERRPQGFGVKPRVKDIRSKNPDQKSQFFLNFPRQTVNIFLKIPPVDYLIGMNGHDAKMLP